VTTASPEDLKTASADTAPLPVDKTVLQRRVPLQQRGQQTLDQILLAAAQVIGAEGLDRLTTKRIAVEAGLSVGTVYEYFPNKEAVLFALVGQWFDRLMQTLEAYHPRNTGTRDILRYLEESIGAVRQVYVDQPALGAMLSALQAIPALREQVEQHDQRVIANMVDALRVVAPGIADEELRVASRAIVLISHELITEALVRDPAHAERLATHMRVCLFAIASHLLIAR
jgi:AcrR family transcriptional regulator